mgnify:CR=1 FL=1
MPISRYDKAYIGVRYGAFRHLKWAISHVEMAYIAIQQKAVKIQITDIQYVTKTSHISRPKESLSANTRLFYGVEQEKRTEKSKSGYKLKVPHIVYFQNEETMSIRYGNRNLYFEINYR